MTIFFNPFKKICTYCNDCNKTGECKDYAICRKCLIYADEINK